MWGGGNGLNVEVRGTHQAKTWKRTWEVQVQNGVVGANAKQT